MKWLAAGDLRARVETRGVAFTAGLRRVLATEMRRFRAEHPATRGRLEVRLFAFASSDGPCRGCLLFARLGGARRSVVASGIDCDARRAIRAAFRSLGQAARRVSERTRLWDRGIQE